MKNAELLTFVKKLRCLECSHTVVLYFISSSEGILLCRTCGNVSLFTQGIFRCLPSAYEIQSTYVSWEKSHRLFLSSHPFIHRNIRKKIRSLPVGRNEVWEDEDVLHWDKRYVHGKGALSLFRKYTRDIYLISPIRSVVSSKDYLLEIGCGLAETVRVLFPPDGNSYRYIASDYSLSALIRLRKIFGNVNNVFFVQCLGNSLPFLPSSVDHILCLGVLHHMPKKEKHIPHIVSILKSGGLLLLNEVFIRGSQLPFTWNRCIERVIEPLHSAHEERINWTHAKKMLLRYGKIIREHYEYSPVRTVLIRFASSCIEKSLWRVKLCNAIDLITIQTVGRLWKVFGAGACLVIFQKKSSPRTL